MTIQCQCDHCGTSLKIKDKLAGTQGKCPKCRKKFKIPDLSSDESDDAVLGGAAASKGQKAPRKSAQQEEEDAIFGDDFFSADAEPARPRRVAPVAAFDDSDEAPRSPKKQPRSDDTEIGVAVESGSGGNASSIASSLLSKTGKRNRPDDFKDPGAPEEVSYDYSEINYLLLHRLLPCIAAAVILFSFFYWMFSGLMGGESELPELAELTGRVTENGVGVAAKLDFLPLQGAGNGGVSGSGSVGVASDDGAYQVFYKGDIKGLILGKHEVRINTGNVRVTREVTIVPGENKLNFELADPAGDGG